MTSRKASAQFIFATLFLDSLGIGLIIPNLPDVVRRFNSNPAFVSDYTGYFISAYAFMQFVASPVLGSLSDKYGRRPVLLVSLLGAAFDYFLMAFAPSLLILFVGRLISGLTGASMTVASSYMADISDDSNRSQNFGLIGAGFGLGFVIGPVIGGLLGDVSIAAPFLAAAALNFVNFVFGYFVLPESLSLENRRQFSLAKINPFGSLRKLLKPSPILGLIFIYFLIYLAGQAHPSIWTLYTQHKFAWTPTEVGISLSFVGISIAVVQGVLTRKVIPWIGENRTISLSLMGYVVTFALFAFATKGWMMYAIMAPFALSGLIGPALQSLISRDTPPQEQGELQGNLMALASLSAILGPIFYTKIFTHFTDESASYYFPGVGYFSASMICLGATLLWVFSKKQKSTSAT